MKKLIYIPVLLLMTSLMMVSCDGLLNVDSERYTFDEDHQMGSTHDSLYAIVGILSQLQLIGDRYVLLGELRGDLMETSDNASRFLKQIYEYNITSENPYASTKEYYSIINNCNYAIQYVDTAVRIKGNRTNYKVMAAAKAIRAWTYLQLVLNYDSANYITEPILSAVDVEKTYESVDLSTLCDYLVDDLLAFRSEESLDLGVFESFNSQLSLLPIRFILGDLYLWKGTLQEGNGELVAAKASYKNAARMYYELMYYDGALITKTYLSSWKFDKSVAIEIDSRKWNDSYSMNSTEALGSLASSPDYGNPFTLDSLCYNRKIAPTENSIENWENQVYFYDFGATTTGDLRELGSVTQEYQGANFATIKFKKPIIIKFINTSNEDQKVIHVYRTPLLYLRYAEAVNRIGCPTFAFAVIKSGLNNKVSNNAVIRKEILAAVGGSSVPSYMSFNTYFTDNIGTRSRGLGNTDTDTTYTIIPAGVDTIPYVEDKIIEELALETAYEGNRFHDLMRVSIRRNNTSYLADKVCIKYTDKDAMRTKLMNKSNWYLPK